MIPDIKRCRRQASSASTLYQNRVGVDGLHDIVDMIFIVVVPRNKNQKAASAGIMLGVPGSRTMIP